MRASVSKLVINSIIIVSFFTLLIFNIVAYRELQTAYTQDIDEKAYLEMMKDIDLLNTSITYIERNEKPSLIAVNKGKIKEIEYGYLLGFTEIKHLRALGDRNYFSRNDINFIDSVYKEKQQLSQKVINLSEHGLVDSADKLLNNPLDSLLISSFVKKYNSIYDRSKNHFLAYQDQRVTVAQNIHFLIFTISIAAFFFIVVIAIWLKKIDSKRSIAEAEIKSKNLELEQRIQERTAKLQESEEKSRSLIEQASDAIYLVDSKGNFIDANASMCKTSGYTREELLQMNVEIILEPEELRIEPFEDRMKALKDSFIVPRKFVRKNGEVYSMEVNVKLFENGRIMVVARDITERKRMEAELEEAELKFRTLAEKSMVGIYIVQNGKFIYVNPRFAEVFGYEQQELINTMPVTHIIHETYRERSDEYVKNRMIGEIESIHYEAMGQRKDGTTNWVEFYGSRTYLGSVPTIIGTMLDITERKKGEESLKKSEANLQTILRTTDIAYALFDTELKVLAFNHMAINFVKEQYKHIPKRGDGLPDFFPTHRFPQFKKFTADVLRGNTVNYEIDYPQADGPLQWFSVRLFPISNDQKEILGLMMALDNITQRKNAQQALQEAYEEKNTILESIGDAFFAVDNHWIVTHWNSQAEKALMTKKSKILGHNLWEVFSDAVNTESYKNYHQAIETNRVIHFEDYYEYLDKWYEVSAYPSAKGLSVYFKDITERKSIQQRMQAERNLLRTLIDNLPQSVYFKDRLARKMISNKVDYEILGAKTETDVIGKTDLELLPPDTGSVAYEQDMAILNTGQPVIGHEHSFRVNDKEVWFLTTKIPLYNDKNEIIGVLGIGRDITQQKSADEKLKALNAELESNIKQLTMLMLRSGKMRQLFRQS